MKTVVVTTTSQVMEMKANMKECAALDVETTTDDKKNLGDFTNPSFKIVTVQVTFDGETAYVIPINHSEYEKQLQVLSEQLKSMQPSIDMDRLYQEDPAEYVKQKAAQDRKKELEMSAKQEQDRILKEKQTTTRKKKPLKSSITFFLILTTSLLNTTRIMSENKKKNSDNILIMLKVKN